MRQGKERGWIASKMSTPHMEQLQNTPPEQRASAMLVNRICPNLRFSFLVLFCVQIVSVLSLAFFHGKQVTKCAKEWVYFACQ